jgi:hypothetical protein
VYLVYLTREVRTLQSAGGAPFLFRACTEAKDGRLHRASRIAVYARDH